MPGNYTISRPGRRSLTISAESVNDAAEQWAVLAHLCDGDEYTLDVHDGDRAWRVRVSWDDGHAVTGAPWEVSDV